MHIDLPTAVGPEQPWKRLVAMIAFGAVGYVLLPLLLLFAVVQFGFSLWAGQGNARLGQLAAAGQAWLGSILNFLLYRSDRLPFPFNPLADEADGAESNARTDAGPLEAGPPAPADGAESNARTDAGPLEAGPPAPADGAESNARTDAGPLEAGPPAPADGAESNARTDAGPLEAGPPAPADGAESNARTDAGPLEAGPPAPADGAESNARTDAGPLEAGPPAPADGAESNARTDAEPPEAGRPARSEWEACLRHLGRCRPAGPGTGANIEQAIRTGAADLLATVGIRLSDVKGETQVAFATRHSALDILFAGTRWKGRVWLSVLQDAPAATRSRIRIPPASNPRYAVLIPLRAVLATFDG